MKATPRTGTNKGLVGSVMALGLVMAFVSPAAATWSIVGVDPETKEVGVAVASCVQEWGLGNLDETLDFLALAPGVGAGVSQAISNEDVPPEMVRLFAAGTEPSAIIDAVISDSFDNQSADRQHGVVAIDGSASGFTGSANLAVAVDQQDRGVSAQGNTLVSEAVITDALAAFNATAGESLATRLVVALEAGSNAGGDSRCPEQTALFAQVVVAKPGDDPTVPTVRLIYTVTEGSGENPVDLLATAYRGGQLQGGTLNGDELPPAKILLPVLLALVAVLGIIGLIIRFVLKRRSRLSTHRRHS